MNIADLAAVPIDDLQVSEKEGTNATTGEPFNYKYTIVDGKEYRIPNSVFDEIKTIIKLKPEIKNVKVMKTGSGLATRYKVEPVN